MADKQALIDLPLSEVQQIARDLGVRGYDMPDRGYLVKCIQQARLANAKNTARVEAEAAVSAADPGSDKPGEAEAAKKEAADARKARAKEDRDLAERRRASADDASGETASPTRQVRTTAPTPRTSQASTAKPNEGTAPTEGDPK